jgi:hypothetical protein
VRTPYAVASRGSFSAPNSVKSRCSTALANFAAQQGNIPRMMEDGVVACLARLLSIRDAQLLENACVALALMAHHPEVKRDVVKQGVVQALIKALESIVEEKTKQACCAVLSSLSFSSSSVVHLVEAGVIEAIFHLSKTDDIATRKRCATALCNISYETTVRVKMVQMGVVKVLAQLSNTYSDETQMDCASCFCNLSCSPENHVPMVKQVNDTCKR